MDLHAVLEGVERWCMQQTAVGDSESVEVECAATVWITIAESAPPWRVRSARRSSGGASAPVAQLRYDVERRDWTLHHGAGPRGWSSEDDSLTWALQRCPRLEF